MKRKTLHKHITVLAQFYCQSILPAASNTILKVKLHLYRVQTNTELKSRDTSDSNRMTFLASSPNFNLNQMPLFLAQQCNCSTCLSIGKLQVPDYIQLYFHLAWNLHQTEDNTFCFRRKELFSITNSFRNCSANSAKQLLDMDFSTGKQDFLFQNSEISLSSRIAMSEMLCSATLAGPASTGAETLLTSVWIATYLVVLPLP